MKILSIDSRKFKKMKKYVIDKSIKSIECELFILEEKNKWNHGKTLLKKYFVNSGEYFSNKLYTINALNDKRASLELEELILPDKLFAIDGEITGFTMPFIEKNLNLEILLNSDSISLLKKVEALKKIGELLRKVMIIGEKQNFYLGDIHESNFIYDIDEQMFKAVDLDSCKIGNNHPSISKYLTFNDKLYDFPKKYPMNDDDIHISNKNTMILSYIYMLLNTISKTSINNLSVDEYYNYLQYLSDNGFRQELIDMFALIYTNGNNTLDLDLLDSVPTYKSKILTYDSFVK